MDAEDYVHRVGRTGRAGNSGHAISFVCPQDQLMLTEIESLIGLQLKKTTLAGYEVGAPLPERYRELMLKPEKTKKPFKSKRKGVDKQVGRRHASQSRRSKKTAK